jgi:hypothetical protein
MARKAQELTPVMVRLPEKLRRWLERAAAENGRSMNTEIIHRLEKSIASESELVRLLDRVAGRLQAVEAAQAEALQALQRLKFAAENGEEGKS